MRYRRLLTIKILQILILLLGSFGITCRAVAGEAQPVGIGLTREASAAPLFIAVEEGYFAAEGLEPHLTFFNDDSLVSAAVASGKLDIGFAALSSSFFSFAAAHDLKMIASRSSDQSRFPMHVLLMKKEAHSARLDGIRELTGARIGVSDTGSSAYYALFDIASRFGLAPDAMKTVSLKSSGDELRALSRQEIDAALLPYPAALHSATRQNSLLPLSNFAQWQQGVVFTTAKDIATKHDLVERFVRAYQHGTADYALNFLQYDDGGDFIPGPRYATYLELIARQAHVSPQVLAMTKTYCDRRANLDSADIGGQVQFWESRGRLDKRIVAADLIDLSFIGSENAAAAQPLQR
jgi:NitT/TauT family transport system substrate-binding protein